MADGTLRNDDLRAALKVLKAEGEGRVGLGAQDLDYTFTPTAFASETSSGVSVPVRIRGSWFDPEIKPDLSKRPSKRCVTSLARNWVFRWKPRKTSMMH